MLGCFAGSLILGHSCLYLNVYRPKGTVAKNRLPVMVYLFGGSFFAGGAWCVVPRQRRN